jgi:hypothetical protein
MRETRETKIGKKDTDQSDEFLCRFADQFETVAEFGEFLFAERFDF